MEEEVKREELHAETQRRRVRGEEGGNYIIPIVILVVLLVFIRVVAIFISSLITSKSTEVISKTFESKISLFMS